jgi:outer membrane protein
MRVINHGGIAVGQRRRPIHPVKPAFVLGLARQVKQVLSSPVRTRISRQRRRSDRRRSGFYCRLAFAARSASNAHASTVKAKMRRNQRVFGHFARGGEKCGSRARSVLRANWPPICLRIECLLMWIIILFLSLFSSVTLAQESKPRVLTLSEAIRLAKANQPQLRQARAGTRAAQARTDQALAPLLPQLSGTAKYQRSLTKSSQNSGTLLSQTNPIEGASSSPNSYNFGVSANQLVYDFGQTSRRLDAAEENVKAQANNERTAALQVMLNVRTAYFSARAAKALVAVARETLANQERHLSQIQGLVDVGTRPQIDLAQSRADRANARVQLINAENSYESAKAQLNQAMGIEGPTDYDVADESLSVVKGEEGSVTALMKEAMKTRPEFAAISNQLKAQRLNIDALEGGYWPSLSVSTGLGEGGKELDSLAWNWNAGVLLSWQFYQGGQTGAQVQEARANLENLKAQVDVLRQQVRLEISQARLAVRAAQAALGATEEVVLNAKERLTLAEGRYEAGIGNIIELGDAQLALTNAEGQQIQAEYNLATARANLLKALGRQ